MDKQNTAQGNMFPNRYRVIFSVLAVLMVVTIFATRIHRVWGGSSFQDCFLHILRVPGHASGYLIIAAPFLILAFMTARWAWLDHNFTRNEFVCRISGVLIVWVIYLYMVRNLVVNAEITNLPMEKWFYPFSIPWLIPTLYWTGYGVAYVIYQWVMTRDVGDKLANPK